MPTNESELHRIKVRDGYECYHLVIVQESTTSYRIDCHVFTPPKGEPTYKAGGLDVIDAKGTIRMRPPTTADVSVLHALHEQGTPFASVDAFADALCELVERIARKGVGD